MDGRVGGWKLIEIFNKSRLCWQVMPDLSTGYYKKFLSDLRETLNIISLLAFLKGYHNRSKH